MMLNDKLIKPQYYFGDDIRKLEFEKIFSENWFFVGMKSDVEEYNSYLTLEIFDYPIVIQNFKGELKAFRNICPHRFNKIQTEVRGTGNLICKYHNWSFDKDGNPKTIPQKNSFDINSDAFNCLKIKSLKLELVGKFIFISINTNPTNIQEYLGNFYNKLLEISNAITTNFYFDDDLQNINWKIIIENVIEAYHCPAIHQKTLYSMGFCQKPEENNQFDNGHSVADYPEIDNAPARNKALKYLENIEYHHDCFRHYFIFPNLIISSTQGTSIYIGNILPVSSEKTILRKRFYSPKFKDNFKPKEAIHKAFLEIAKTSINQILAEDKAILEQIQKNMPFVCETYFLGTQETRIADFHKKYLQTING